MKLEAVDKKNPAFICVATVTDMVDNRFLVHFDNWDESYDYWWDIFHCCVHFLIDVYSSTYLKPVIMQSREHK